MTIMVIKIATLNVCLGLTNKKDLVKQIILNEKIDILCVQETELNTELCHNLLSFPGYSYESEKSSIKARIGTYVSNAVKYVRRLDLEIEDCHVMIFDVLSKPNLRLINIYRSFNPPNNTNPREFFNKQINLIRQVITNNTMIVGDFNLDWSRKGHNGYAFNTYFGDMESAFEGHVVDQLVNFTTWTRTVGGVVRESIIDHIYSTNSTLASSLGCSKPCFGDHFLIHVEYCMEREASKPVYRRNWKNYSKENLINMLSEADWDIKDDTVQGFWNSLENKIINIIDGLIPLSAMTSDVRNQSSTPRIKNLMNVRKRLVKKLRTDKSADLRIRVQELNKEIKRFFNTKKTVNVRRVIKPGNCQSLWKAVKIAKDVNLDSLPKSMSENNIEIPNEILPDRFAKFFNNKIVQLLADVTVHDEVYNGSRRVVCSDSNFMDLESVIICMKSMKSKNSEGYDRIPQRILVDGVDVLAVPMQKLMSLIYSEVKIPEQWLVSKTIPIFKNKGQKREIENYRPIANLCSSSKVFEKLILRRILQIESEKKVDFTGKKPARFQTKQKHIYVISSSLITDF